MKGTTNAQRNAIIDSTSAVDSLTLTKADGTTQKHTVSNIIPKDDAPTSGSSKFVTSGAIYTALDGKVSVVSGKGLSTNDYTTAEKSKVSNLPANANTTFATKTELTDALSSVYKYKGSVNTYDNLPSNATAGDVYNVVNAYDNVPAGTNWAWNGSSWDALGGTVTGYVADTTTVNGKPLSSNVTLTAADVSAVPTTRTVNGKALSSDISLTASDVGALATNGTAAKATADASGNVITDTYATKSALTTGLAGKQNALTFDSAPTSGSSNPVTSGGVYSAINNVSTRVSGCVNGAQYEGNTLTFTKDSGDTFSVTISRPEGGTIGVTLNAPSSGLYPNLVGITVSASNGTDTYYGTTDDSRYCEIKIDKPGKYTISANPEYFDTAPATHSYFDVVPIDLTSTPIEYDFGTAMVIDTDFSFDIKNYIISGQSGDTRNGTQSSISSNVLTNKSTLKYTDGIPSGSIQFTTKLHAKWGSGTLYYSDVNIKKQELVEAFDKFIKTAQGISNNYNSSYSYKNNTGRKVKIRYRYMPIFQFYYSIVDFKPVSFVIYQDIDVDGSVVDCGVESTNLSETIHLRTRETWSLDGRSVKMIPAENSFSILSISFI